MNESSAQTQAEIAATASQSRTKLRSRVTLIALFLAFFGPILIAITMYARLDIWQPSPSYNHGELLLPVQQLSYLELQDAQGEPVNLQTLEGRWYYIFVGAGACGLQCEASLFKIRQLRALLGRDLQRVQYLFAALDAPALNSALGLQQDHPRMEIGRVAQGQAKAQAAAFGDAAGGHVFLVDPLGNLVLRYDDSAKTKGMLKDIRRLLKVSKIG